MFNKYNRLNTNDVLKCNYNSFCKSHHLLWL